MSTSNIRLIYVKIQQTHGYMEHNHVNMRDGYFNMLHLRLTAAVAVCFCLLGFYVPLENFSLIWGRHHYRWRAANFELYSALMAIEHWRFFSIPRLLWHGTSIYKGHFRVPVTHTHLLPSVCQWSCHCLFTT